MTLLVAWVSKDDKPQGKETSALYIGADSRYSWSPDYRRYDYGQKTYACRNSPDIFGFCGDVTFCTMVISQLTTLIDTDCLFNPTDGIGDKAEKVRLYIHSAFIAYPKDRLRSFTILHGTRASRDFALSNVTYTVREGISFKMEAFPPLSNQIYIGGSGGREFRDNWINADADRNNNSKTSRNIFHCLSDTIRHIKDQATGGAPQAVGLFRGGNGMTFGIIENGRRSVGGREVGPDLNLDSIEWRNSDFERMNPISLRRKKDAARHYF